MILKYIKEFFQNDLSNSSTSAKSIEPAELEIVVTGPIVNYRDDDFETGYEKYTRINGIPAWLTLLGNTTPNCPYCEHVFEKMPARKRKCPSCKKTFYSRIRPIDNQKSLLTKNDVETAWFQSTIINEEYNFIVLCDNVRNELFKSRESNYVPLGDILWNVYGDLSTKAIREKDFKLYAEIQRLRAIQREHEGGLKSSLTFHIENIHLLANGASNAEPYFTNSKDVNKYNRYLFRKNKGFDLHVETGDLKDLYKIWVEVGNKVNKQFKLTIPTENVWAIHWNDYCQCIAVETSIEQLGLLENIVPPPFN